MKWINLGDVNFFQHGGYLVRPMGSSKTEFEVIRLVRPVYGYIGKYREPCLIYKCYVDVSDFTDERHVSLVKKYCGCNVDLKSYSGVLRYVTDILSCWGEANFQPQYPKEAYYDDGYIVGSTVAARFMKENDVDYKYRH